MQILVAALAWTIVAGTPDAANANKETNQLVVANGATFGRIVGTSEGQAALPVPPAPALSAIALPRRFVGGNTASGPWDVKQESLGKQTIEGVEAERRRTPHTLPAGAVGNERPIEVVYERWVSPELQIVIMARHSHPRVGETVYRLTNLSRSEPDASLFRVPGDYNIHEFPSYTAPPAELRKAKDQ